LFYLVRQAPEFFSSFFFAIFIRQQRMHLTVLPPTGAKNLLALSRLLRWLLMLANRQRYL
jgi:hypothetical protein